MKTNSCANVVWGMRAARHAFTNSRRHANQWSCTTRTLCMWRFCSADSIDKPRRTGLGVDTKPARLDVGNPSLQLDLPKRHGQTKEFAAVSGIVARRVCEMSFRHCGQLWGVLHLLGHEAQNRTQSSIVQKKVATPPEPAKVVLIIG